MEVLKENCNIERRNALEQDHRTIQRWIRASQHFRFFWEVWCTIAGYGAVHMIRKGQAPESTTGTGFGLLYHVVLWRSLESMSDLFS
jgi:transposase-like protein